MLFQNSFPVDNIVYPQCMATHVAVHKVKNKSLKKLHPCQDTHPRRWQLFTFAAPAPAPPATSYSLPHVFFLSFLNIFPFCH